MKHICSVLSYVAVGIVMIIIMIPQTVKTVAFTGKDLDEINLTAENNMDDEAVIQSTNQLSVDMKSMMKAKADAESMIPASSITKPAIGDQFGEVAIESVGISMKLYYGDTNYILSIGAGMYAGEGGVMPGFGGLTLIAAHNGKGQFGELEKAAVGDLVTVTTPYGVCKYKVRESKVVNCNDTTAYDLTVKDDELILYTCYPMYYSAPTDRRLFLYCVRESGPIVK